MMLKDREDDDDNDSVELREACISLICVIICIQMLLSRSLVA